MNDRLQFFAASRDVAPGQGTGEQVSSQDTYVQLAKIPKWRAILSNLSDVCIDTETSQPKGFQWNKSTWRTVEHAFQAHKFIDTPSEYYKFTMECDPSTDGYWARKHRKLRVLTPSELKHWDSIKHDIMTQLWKEKFTQDPKAREVLLATGDAELWHSAPRMKAERWSALESLREELRMLN
jgi:predicted NAD-dependent protein-ADP-ribosyltransferase YbiA (DUF1768 family)